MFCREQIAQLRDITPRIRDRGAELVVIGNGDPKQASAFARARDLDFPLLTDPRRDSYRAAGLRRDVASTFNLSLVKNAGRALRGGHFQSTVQGDPWQQGGAFVFAPGDVVLFSQISKTAGDHADPEDLLAALP